MSRKISVDVRVWRRGGGASANSSAIDRIKRAAAADREGREKMETFAEKFDEIRSGDGCLFEACAPDLSRRQAAAVFARNNRQLHPVGQICFGPRQGGAGTRNLAARPNLGRRPRSSD
jgi:hypothetical protein